MTPSARLAAVLDIGEIIESEKRPADILAATYFKARRYIGAKDRRAISDRLWGMLRRHSRLNWWLRHHRRQPDPRGRLLVDLAINDKLTLPEFKILFAGGVHGPRPLDAQERDLLHALHGASMVHKFMPDWVQGEYPEWMDGRLRSLFGSRLAAEMGALREAAPVDLRVNTLKSDIATAKEALAKEGLEAKETFYSPLGLRLSERTALTAQEAFRQGFVEVQDEGSQLVALLADARPGMMVADFCAGAGGKTLTMAAAMQNKGRIFALDVEERRLDRAGERLRRAGVDNVARHAIESESAKWLKRQAERCDRVLVDAPCSGTGAWRRNPDAKWRLQPEDLAELVELQSRILVSSARLVRPGGRLIYATCSLLEEENEERISQFLIARQDFKLLPIMPIWQSVIGHDCPTDGDYLRLSPSRHGTDGFFVAVMERSA